MVLGWRFGLVWFGLVVLGRTCIIKSLQKEACKHRWKHPDFGQSVEKFLVSF